MGSLFEELKQGLEEAVSYEQGKGRARAVTYVIEPVREFARDEIRKTRMDAGMTQMTLASYMGVSKKTVEAWECGRTHPTGPANRLLELLRSGAGRELPFITEVTETAAEEVLP